MKLINTVLRKMSNISKPQRKFISILLTTMTLMRGRVTFRNLSRYSHLSEKTYSRNFRKDFPFPKLNVELTSPVIKNSNRYIGALDCSFIEKSGKGTHGLGNFYDSKVNKAHKGLEVSLFSIVDVDYNTAYPLCIDQTPPLNNDEKSRVDWYVNQISSNRSIIPPQIDYIVGDAYYSKKKVVDGVLNEDFHFIGKLRKDSNLRWLYQGPQKKGRGRKKQYDGKVKFNDLSRFEIVSDNQERSLYTAVVNSVCFKRNIRIVYVIEKKGSTSRRSLLFSTDIDQAPEEILQFYKARFQIEFLFRDARQYTGLGDCQARCKESLHFHFNASMAALNLLKVEDRLSKRRSDSDNKVISISNWKTRNFNDFMLKSFSSMLGLNFNFIKKHKHYENIKNLGAIVP